MKELRLRNDRDSYKIDKDTWYYLEGKRGVSLVRRGRPDTEIIQIPLKIIKTWFK